MRHVGFVAAALAVAGLSGSARALDLEELEALDLTELLAVRLNTIGLSDIHHTHEKGEWMVGLSSMFMHMSGNRDGATRQSRSAVLSDFMVTPTRMDMQMHMLHLMYAPTQRVTLMAMMPWHVKAMDHVTRNGTRFTTRADGPGDLVVSALIRLYEEGPHQVLLKTGVSAPTGSIDRKDDTPMGRVRLPYPMQIGSGTWDPIVGFTYLGQVDPGREGAAWTWGLHGEGRFRTGRNGNHYRLGHHADASAWAAREVLPFASLSLRAHGQAWGDVHGADPDLVPAMVPTADPDLRSGRRVDLLAGLNLYATEGWLAGQRISIEGGVPVYQWLDGPQLETDWRLRASWNWVF